MEIEQIIYGMCAASDYSNIIPYTSTKKYRIFKQNNLTIYKSKYKSACSDAVILLSGGFVLEFASYIRKFIDDMKFECDIYMYVKTRIHITCFVSMMLQIL